MAAHKAILLSSMLTAAHFITFTQDREFIVGGQTNAWEPSSKFDSLNTWAEAFRFQIGDSLVYIYRLWTYDPNKDSVLQVTKKDYETCNISSPIAVYKDGKTKVKLERSGPYYFINGAEGHCTVVLSARYLSISPAPSPVGFEGPVVAPTSGGVSLRSGLLVIFGCFSGLYLF
ncbi:LOW QUALITY PROTEIN: Cu_bind_like domain-containing protein [Cephalotus follicularis]|uniref:Cu_bind_like domain-containing protein n=1 Tax=Cephalotus follicularis TaxID=3775 RepID=A0A1Q3CQD6_CEPFO|nr:LOW QUALITY PROTEIN: Cu_bind_like domain-containing protein [Cephalotus follicularis]